MISRKISIFTTTQLAKKHSNEWAHVPLISKQYYDFSGLILNKKKLNEGSCKRICKLQRMILI